MCFSVTTQIDLAPPTRATTLWAPVQTSPASTQYQLVSTGVNLVSRSIKLVISSNFQKSPFRVTLQKNGILAVSDSDLGLELTTSSLRQNSSWACFQFNWLFALYQSSSADLHHYMAFAKTAKRRRLAVKSVNLKLI